MSSWCRSTIGRGDQLHRVHGHVRMGETLPHGRRYGPVRMHRLGTAPEDDGVAGSQTERGGIRRHVGSALVDHRDDPERDPHPGDPQSVGPHVLLLERAEGILLPRDLSHRARDARYPRGIQPQPVTHRAGDTPLVRCGEIACIRLEDVLGCVFQGCRDLEERSGSHFAGQPRQAERRGPGPPAQLDD